MQNFFRKSSYFSHNRFYLQRARPTEEQRRQLAIGLESRQIMVWFQNKRTQEKAENEHADISTLRTANHLYRIDNITMGEAFRNAACRSCGPCGSAPFTEEERNKDREKLELENVKLKREVDRLYSIVSPYKGIPLSRPTSEIRETVIALPASGIPAFKFDSLIGNKRHRSFVSDDQMKPHLELEKHGQTSVVSSYKGRPLSRPTFEIRETVIALPSYRLDSRSKRYGNFGPNDHTKPHPELEKHGQTSIVSPYMSRPLSKPTLNIREVVAALPAGGNPALKFDSLIGNSRHENFGLDDQAKLHPESDKPDITWFAQNAMNELVTLLRVDQPLWIKSPTTAQYVLDYDSYYMMVLGLEGFKYPNSCFESSKETSIVAMDARSLVDLYLDTNKWVELFPTTFSEVETIYVLRDGLLETHSNSMQREFYLLRHCREIFCGVYVILDVSYQGAFVSQPICWRYPSGCMIEETPNGLSKVTCVEHVQVDRQFLVHSIYENFVKSTLAFGAKMWISTLRRTIERYSLFNMAACINSELEIGRRNMIMLTNKMMKNYCSIFSGFETSDFHQLSEMNNSVGLVVRMNICPDQPVGIVIQVASSFWVPASPERVFSYLNDHFLRSEVLKIQTGCHSSNAISILQPQDFSKDFMIFQESVMEETCSLIVYAPVDKSSVHKLTHGIDSPHVPILASGFSITPDGFNWKDSPSTSSSKQPWVGSLITAAFQILTCTDLSSLMDVSSDLH